MRLKKAPLNTHGILKIEGHCIRPHAFSYLDLAAIHRYYQIPDMSKIDQRLSGVGVRLRKLIDIVGPDYRAAHLIIESEDGEFTASVPLRDVAKTAVVIYGAKAGAPLEREQGGPARLVIPYHPDKCANVKNLGRIVVSRTPGEDTRPSQHKGAAAAAS